MTILAMGPDTPQESWYFFLAIESDLDATSRYVEPTAENNKTYSIEFARILMSAAAEVEVVAKLLLATKGASLPGKPTIEDLRKGFQKHYPKLPNMEVMVPRGPQILRPWAAWEKGSANPDWWLAYTAVKHSRHSTFHQATLANALNAVAALFCLQLYLHQALYNAGILQPWSRLLTLEKHYQNVVAGTGGMLPDFPRV